MRSIVLIVLIFLLSSAILAKNNKYGVFVGISNYVHIDKLPSSINDAKKMCDTFSKKCNTGNTTLLLDKQATREAIIESIVSFQNKVSSGDMFIFYYSGHGTFFPDEYSDYLDENPFTGINMNSLLKKATSNRKLNNKSFDSALVPFDADKTTSGKAWNNLILDDELFILFAKLINKGAKVVFISDSCHSGGQYKGGLVIQTPKPSKIGVPKYVDMKAAIGVSEKNISVDGVQLFVDLTTILEFSSYLLIASSGETEYSYSQNPDTGTDNSLFTYSLLEVFKEFKEKKKKFTIQDIETKVKPMVMKFADMNNAIQTPIVKRDFYKGELDFSIFD